MEFGNTVELESVLKAGFSPLELLPNTEQISWVLPSDLVLGLNNETELDHKLTYLRYGQVTNIGK